VVAPTAPFAQQPDLSSRAGQQLYVYRKRVVDDLQGCREAGEGDARRALDVVVDRENLRAQQTKQLSMIENGQHRRRLVSGRDVAVLRPRLDPSPPLGIPIFCNARGRSPRLSGRGNRQALRFRAFLSGSRLPAQAECAVDQADMTIGLRKIT
jgi:hypothetical protein